MKNSVGRSAKDEKAKFLGESLHKFIKNYICSTHNETEKRRIRKKDSGRKGGNEKKKRESQEASRPVSASNMYTKKF